ncbi:polysaccharide deacetylase family protein [Burkholderia pseudomultivorans]|uniref:polysaccharide deacetylase family protein n=1 Tax=Burkholderia pseudomultivorans TaxID=1207504 RepID=UPI00075CF701|nr:polysaccharide deacetylase [Burkholderia pseudomultivorans]KWF05213.1 polysaccharide deacetylase [Burkholderia pseudomultivorans]MBF5008989.1 polysaccharide deacetylase [Burkholderia pseudomultivorans]
MTTPNAATLKWPNTKSTAVSLTFDVDAEAGYLGESPAYARRLTSLSEGRFGVVRGVPRIVDLLRRHRIPATFFVPGHTAEQHPKLIESLLKDGHEIGHHGHMHLRSDKVSAEAQADEMRLGLAALQKAGAPKPAGYRSSSWELTPETFDLVLDNGFVYDSSCMGDDRPYHEHWNGRSILELPVHWSLDDYPMFGWTIDNGGNFTAPRTLVDTWLAEYESARRDGRHTTFTMHPEVIGRGARFDQLERFVERLVADGDVWFARLDEVARHVMPQLERVAA